MYKRQGNEDAIAETVTVTLPANAGAKRAGTLTVKTEFEEYTFTTVSYTHLDVYKRHR